VPPAQQSTPTSRQAHERHWLPESKAARTPWSINILLVEDDAADASLILSALRRHPDVAAAHAMDRPEAALRLLASNSLQPDLILLDIHMPRIDGFEFVERLRDIPTMFDTPVVFLTTSRLAKNVEAARDASVCLYVVKPDSFADLQARLDVVIKRAKSGEWS
jgi:two-component system cell cycle response regulator